MVKTVAHVLLLTLVALVFSIPLFTHRPLPWGCDLHFHYQLADNLGQMVRDAVLYPRWIDKANSGFGAPVFLFYSPLGAYAVTAASLVTGNLIDAFKLVIVIAVFLSGLTFYLAARPLGSPAAAVLGASFYMLAPYHILDLYVRFAFAEFLAFVWMPLLFLYCRRVLLCTSRSSWFGLVFAYCGLVFTHLVTAFMSLFVLTPYVLYYAVRTRRWGGVAKALAAGAAALFCAAVFLVPMLNQRDEVHSEFYVKSHYGDWRRNLLYTDEVALGYSKDRIKTAWVQPSSTCQAGLSLAAAAWFVALAVAWRRRPMAAPMAEGIEEYPPGGDSASREGWAQILLCAWTFFLQTPLSKAVWSSAPSLGTIQFPWRFASFQALAASFAVCCAVSLAADWRSVPAAFGASSGRKAWRPAPGGALRSRIVLALAALSIGLAAIPGLVLSIRLTGVRHYVFDENLASSPKYANLHNYEFMPKGLRNWEDFPRMPEGTIPRVFLKGAGTAEVVSWNHLSREIRVRAEGAVTLYLRTFAYPGWRATANGKEIAILPDPESHAITVDLPVGEHLVRFVFTATADRKVGAAVSSLAILGLTIGGIFAWRTGRERRGQGMES